MQFFLLSFSATIAFFEKQVDILLSLEVLYHLGYLREKMRSCSYVILIFSYSIYKEKLENKQNCREFQAISVYQLAFQKTPLLSKMVVRKTTLQESDQHNNFISTDFS